MEARSSNLNQEPSSSRHIEWPIPVGRTLPGTHQRAAAWEAGPGEQYTFDADDADPVVVFRRHLRFGRDLAVHWGSTRFVFDGVTERVLPRGTSSEPELLDLLGDVVRRADTPRPGQQQHQQEELQEEQDEDEAAEESDEYGAGDICANCDCLPSIQYSLRPTTETSLAQDAVPTSRPASPGLIPFPELPTAPTQDLSRPQIDSLGTEAATGSPISSTATATLSDSQTETSPRPRTRARSNAFSLPRPLEDF